MDHRGGAQVASAIKRREARENHNRRDFAG